MLFSSPESLLGNGRWRRFPKKIRTFVSIVFVEISCVNSFVFHKYIHYVLTFNAR